MNTTWNSELRDYRSNRPAKYGRRFCCECSRLRTTYYTKRNAGPDDLHYCSPCAVKLGFDITRNAFANR